MRSTTTAGLLARALARTEPHVDRTDDQPELAAIRLEAAGSHLYAVATDRFTLAVDRIYAENTGPWHAHLHRADIQLVRLWLDSIDPGTWIRVGAAPSGDGAAITLRAGHLMLRVVNNCPEQQQFPAWRQLLRRRLDTPADMVPLTSYNPDHLARFAPVDLDAVHAWQASPTDPLIVVSDDGFVGMVMPVKRAAQNRALITAALRRGLTAA